MERAKVEVLRICRALVIVTILVLAVGLASTVGAAEAGLRWDEAVGAEGYYVYWRTPSTSFNATDTHFYPVCGGYYDTTPPSLISGSTCVLREIPMVLVAVLPDEPPVVVMALKGANEVGLSVDYSNEVRKHNLGADPVGNARRTEAPPTPVGAE